MLQVRTHRGTITDPISLDSIGQLDATRRDAYLRFGVGTPDAGPWFQAIAATTRYQFAGEATPVPTTTDTTAVPGDTSVSAAQYVLTGGFTRWGIHLSGAARYFASFTRGFVAKDSAHDTVTVQRTRRGYVERAGGEALLLAARAVRAERAGRLRPVEVFGGGVRRGAGARFDLAPRGERRVHAVQLSPTCRRHGLRARRPDGRQPPHARLPSPRGGLRIHDFWLGGGTIMRGAVHARSPDAGERFPHPRAGAVGDGHLRLAPGAHLARYPRRRLRAQVG